MNHLFDGLLEGRDGAQRFAEIPGESARHYSYADVLAVSARFANVLVAHGVKPGDRVAAQVPKSIEAVMLYLAVVRAGAVFLPLNTAYTASEVEYFLTDATPAIFIGDPLKEDVLGQVAQRAGAAMMTMGVWTKPEVNAGSFLEEGLSAETEFRSVPRAGDDLAAILYTSGTTGRSKGAMLSHGNLLSNAKTLADYWRFTPEDVLIHALPIFHTHGLFVAINITLVAGGSLIFLPHFDAEEILSNMPNASALMGVPTFYTRLLDHEGLTKDASAHMRLFVSGSAPLLADTHDAWRERTGHAILERYGMTETSMNTSNPYDGERRAGTVGYPLPGVDVRVTDEAGTALGAGEIGAIEVRGPNVFSGYWQMPEKTAEEMRADGFFITGDVGVFSDDGYLSIVGRSKDLVISGGYNVYPKEVELLIDALPGVQESAVIGVPHPDFGEGVVAVVVPSGVDLIEEGAVIGALSDCLARYKQPKRVFVVDELPRNAMGKVQKAALRERFGTVFGG
ncbi:MAG: malonyl-CoA synthase [Pseudomonadota bacterium]